MADDILVNVALAGQDQVVDGFGKIGLAGIDMFAKLESAAFGGSAIFAGLTAGVAAIGAGLFEFTKHTSEATFELEHLATQAGTTVEDMSALRGALTGLGADADSLNMAFRRLAIQIETQWSQIRKSIKDRSDQVINDQLGVVSSVQSVERAEMALVRSKDALNVSRGGSKNEELEAYLKQKEAVLAVAEAENKLAEARQKASEATKKQREDTMNSMEAISEAVKSITSGQANYQQASQNANLELNKVMQGLIANAGPAGAALEGFKGNLNDLAGAEPKVRDVFLQLADFMHNSGDSALNTALAFRLFGRGVGQDMVQALTEGRAAIEQQMDHFKKFGLVIDEDGAKPTKEFIKDYRTLSYELGTTLQQIGNLFAPAFSEGFKLMSGVLENNHGAILSWAHDMAGPIKDAIVDFFRVLSGGDALKFTWLNSARDVFSSFGSWLKNTVGPTIADFFRLLNGEEAKTEWMQTWARAFGATIDFVKTALKAFWSLLETTAEYVNKAFGTDKVTAAGLAIAGIAILAMPPWLRLAIIIGGVITMMDKMVQAFANSEIGVKFEATMLRAKAAYEHFKGTLSDDAYVAISDKINQNEKDKLQAVRDGTYKANIGIQDSFSDTAKKIAGATAEATSGIKMPKEQMEQLEAATKKAGDAAPAATQKVADFAKSTAQVTPAKVVDVNEALKKTPGAAEDAAKAVEKKTAAEKRDAQHTEQTEKPKVAAEPESKTQVTGTEAGQVKKFTVPIVPPEAKATAEELAKQWKELAEPMKLKARSETEDDRVRRQSTAQVVEPRGPAVPVERTKDGEIAKVEITVLVKGEKKRIMVPKVGTAKEEVKADAPEGEAGPEEPSGLGRQTSDTVAKPAGAPAPTLDPNYVQDRLGELRRQQMNSPLAIAGGGIIGPIASVGDKLNELLGKVQTSPIFAKSPLADSTTVPQPDKDKMKKVAEDYAKALELGTFTPAGASNKLSPLAGRDPLKSDEHNPVTAQKIGPAMAEAEEAAVSFFKRLKDYVTTSPIDTKTAAPGQPGAGEQPKAADTAKHEDQAGEKLNELGQAVGTLASAVQGATSDITNANTAEKQSSTADQEAAQQANELAGGLSAAAEAAQRLASAEDSASQNKAEGGHITGPGSTTSDSIPANLSHDEYVQPAKATHHYGLNFMESVRTLSFPRTMALGGLVKGFNAGGLVEAFRSPQHFAFGGLASPTVQINQPVMPTQNPVNFGGQQPIATLHPLTLRLPDGKNVTGLYAQPTAVASLMQIESTLNQIARIGPSQGWNR